ncbi:MAG TPA: hypothetical protein VIH55_04395 [Acidimicrobiia bacterium]
MSERPSRPQDALAPEDLQRFIYACSHERRSPTTHRLIDAASYGWIHMFIRNHGEDAPPQEPGPAWLDPHDADPQKLGDFFGRVAIRLRSTGAFDYATLLERHFHELAAEQELPWPLR